MNQPTNNPAGPSPIADLSYRNYDGPLHNRAARWWIVALAGIRLVKKKPGFWILAVIATLPFAIQGILLYFQGAMHLNDFNPMVSHEKGKVFSSLFFTSFSNQQFWLFLISLMVGSASIAADNRANALLVYLSKPITKGDYLLGKWMGVFLTLFAIGAIPAFMLWIYCFLSFNSDGFVRDEPLLLFRAIFAAGIPAAVHASLIVGISAWSKTPRLAGAIYAGAYFISQAIALASWGIRYQGDFNQGVILRHLSPEGAISGLGQNVYGVVQPIPSARHGLSFDSIPPPTLGVMILLFGGLVAAGVIAARMRIRAVEVVRG